MNDRQVDALGLQEMIRSERTREKSRSWVTRGTITPRECVISRLQGPGQHLGDGDGRYGETQVPSSMSFEERLEARSEFRVPLEEVDDGRRIDEQQRILRKIREI